MNRIACLGRPRITRTSAFTLVELLAVIAIIVILSGIGVGAARYASQRADASRVRTEMEIIANAMERHRVERGAYPGTDGTTFQNMSIGGSWAPPFNAANVLPFMDGLPHSDPWGTSYQYRRMSRFSFQLRSLGPDMSAGTPDDIIWPF